ncbi:AMP-binding protein, partial [Candidatus Woesearchaeota archaeon]|nr:AMP-binding protein [Candidatus Woesearchaeota archaeon]
MEQEPKTLNEMLTNSVSLHDSRTAFKVKKDNIFDPISYEEFYNKVKGFGTGLLAVGIEKFDHIGLITDNRLEWIISSLAINGLRAADIPLPGSTGYEDISFKLNHSDSKAVIFEGETQLSEFYNV